MYHFFKFFYPSLKIYPYLCTINTNNKTMDEKTKELLAKARKLQKQLKDIPLTEMVLEDKVCSGMYADYQIIGRLIMDMPDDPVPNPTPKPKKRKKDKK